MQVWCRDTNYLDLMFIIVFVAIVDDIDDDVCDGTIVILKRLPIGFLSF